MVCTIGHKQGFLDHGIVEVSQQYAGFRFGAHTYVFLRTPFGVKTAGAKFTRGMARLLGPELENVIIIYLDDLLIFAKTWLELLALLRRVLQKIIEGELTVNKEKCRKGVTEVKFLGHVMNQFKMRMMEETKETITNFPRPKGKKQLQAFWGWRTGTENSSPPYRIKLGH